MIMIAQIDIATTYGVKLGTIWSLNTLVSAVLTASMAIAGLIFMFMVAAGGFAVMSGGGDDPQKAAKGRASITSGLIGFIVIIVAYWIIAFIEEVVGVDFISGPGI